MPRPHSYSEHSISFPTPYENVLGTPIYLPTTEPGSPQFSWTVASGDLPTISGLSYILIGDMDVCGKNEDSIGRSIYWRMKKNGDQVAYSSSGVSAGYFWTVRAMWTDITIGDTLDLYLWTQVSDVVYYEFDGHCVLPTRFFLSPLKGSGIISRIYVSTMQYFPQYVASGLNPESTTQVVSFPRGIDGAQVLGYIVSTDFPLVPQHSTYGFLRVTPGDRSYPNMATLANNATYHPYFFRNLYPAALSVYKFLGDVK